MGNCSQAEHYKFHSSWTNIAANQEAFVTQEINDLLKSGAIEECLEQPLCVSPIGSACQKRTASFG